MTLKRNKYFWIWIWIWIYAGQSTAWINSSPTDACMCDNKLSLFLAATKQLYDWFRPSVRLSTRLSVRHALFTTFPSSYHHEIFRSYYHGQKWCQCKRSRSKVKVTEVKPQLSRFRTITPVWIHIWKWNHVHSLKWHSRGVLLFFKVLCEISRSHGAKNCRFWPEFGVSGL